MGGVFWTKCLLASILLQPKVHKITIESIIKLSKNFCGLLWFPHLLYYLLLRFTAVHVRTYCLLTPAAFATYITEINTSLNKAHGLKKKNLKLD